MVTQGTTVDVEFEPLHHDENGGELPEHGEPAQPQDRVEADIAARMAKIGGGDFGHGRNSSRAGSGPQICQALPDMVQCLALAAAMAQGVVKAMPAQSSSRRNRRRNGPHDE